MYKTSFICISLLLHAILATFPNLTLNIIFPLQKFTSLSYADIKFQICLQFLMTKVIYIWADIINKVDKSLWVHQDYKERLFNLIPSQDTLQGLNILWSAQTDHTLLYLMALFQLSKYIHIYICLVSIFWSACWPKKKLLLLKNGIPTLLINAGCLNFNVYLQSKIL